MKIMIDIPDSEVPTSNELFLVSLQFIDSHVCECTYPFEELKAEPCADCVSRQTVKDIMVRWRFRDENAWRIADAKIEKLPSVNPAPRIGRWIPVGYDGYADGNPVYDWWECSECDWEHTGEEDTLTPYCPNCGAKMEVDE